jgi:hippurate hydrolase
MSATAIEPEELRQRVRRVLPQALELRHRLHRIPEVGLQERRTAELLRATLAAENVELLPPYLETDVTGLVRGRSPTGMSARSPTAQPGGEARQGGRREAGGMSARAPAALARTWPRCVLLRADIDALPLEEKRERPWKSEHAGSAHACGHDGHMAMLAGAVAVLAGLTERFAGTVRFVFQPGEEEVGGGLRLIERGLLEAEPRPQAAFALHGWPGLPEGRLGALPGVAMAAADGFSIVIHGRGGHGAKPHLAIDPILAAAQVVTSLQSIVARNVNPLEPAVISVCTLRAGSATNVIPEQARLAGTVRYFDPDLKHLLRTRMEEVVRGVCEAAGAEHEFEYYDGYIPLVNDPQRVSFARETVQAYLGAWHEGLERTMGAEDFAFYLQRVPGALLLLGLGEGWPALHNPEFDFNDRALEPGITTLAALALETMKAA